ncbi:Ras GTPase-activating protein 1 [Geranomyces michiganensis]|nr:Ras GTPase-activating protein 1 [Geranomyces michiganensis]
MTCSSALQYTDESVRQCRELAVFLRKRSMVEMEYAKSLFKLAQGYQKSQALDASSKDRESERRPSTTRETERRPSTSGERGGDHIRAQLLQTSVWTTFYEYVDQITKTAETHRNLALAMQNNVMEPFTILIKDMEVVRKMQVDRSVDQMRNLQDAYAGLKRAKEEYDALQSNANEMQQNLQRTRMTTNAREKELEKLANRANVATDKADAANEALQVFGEICKDSQEQYYGQILPSLFEDIKKRELERLGAVKKVLADVVYLEKTCRDTTMSAIDTVSERLGAIDLEDDSEEFQEAHMADEVGQQGRNVSVAALANPVKAGRMLLKRGDFVAGWKSRYFVLMDEGMLYCFDNEAAAKPREIISLAQSAVHHLDNSYFTKPHCLQIVSMTRKGRQTHNLIAETAAAKSDWMRLLRRYASCCIKGVVAREHTGVHSPPDMNEDGFTITRSFTLSVMEAKELKGSQGLTGLNPYCIALLDDVKQSRTTTKSGDAPFWGEDFEIPNMCEHFSRLRLVVFNHSRLQRDTDLGYVSINLNTSKSTARVEHWYPIKQLPRPNHTDTTSKGSIRVAFSLVMHELLPAEHYADFVRLVTEPSLAGIKMLGTVCGTQREAIAKVFISVMMSKRMELQGLRTLLGDEIHATDNPNIIFRGNSMATKSLDQYMKVVGTSYLVDTIGLLVRQVYNAKDSCEVDPTRVENPDTLARNWRKLKSLVESFWDAISRSVRSCPRELKEVFAFVRETALNKWNGADGTEPNQSVQYVAISGFIFLRFFCPAILNPKIFNLISEQPDPSTSRTFTLIAKILQNLANLSDFGSKEPYMAECNPFIAANVNSMKAFIDGISTIEPEGVRSPSPPNRDNAPASVPRKDIESLYQFFANHLDPLTEQAGDSTVLQELLRECRMLQATHEEYRSGVNVGGSVASFTSEEALQGLSSKGGNSGAVGGGDGLRRLMGSFTNRDRVAEVAPVVLPSASLAHPMMHVAQPELTERPPQISLTDFSSNTSRIKPSPSFGAIVDNSRDGGSLEELHDILDAIAPRDGFSNQSSPAPSSPLGRRRRPSDSGTASPIPPERKGSRNVDLPPGSGSHNGWPMMKNENLERYYPPPPDPPEKSGLRGHVRKKSGAGKGFIKALMNVGGSSGGGNGGDRDTGWMSSFGDRKRYGSTGSIASNNSSESLAGGSRRASTSVDNTTSASGYDPFRTSRGSIDVPSPSSGGSGGLYNGPILESTESVNRSNESIHSTGSRSGFGRFRGTSGEIPRVGSFGDRGGSSEPYPPSVPLPPMPDMPVGIDPFSLGEDESASMRSSRLRSMSMGNKVKNRLSVIWQKGERGGR